MQPHPLHACILLAVYVYLHCILSPNVFAQFLIVATPSSTSVQSSTMVTIITVAIGSGLIFSLCFVSCSLIIWLYARKLKWKGRLDSMNEHRESLLLREDQDSILHEENTPAKKTRFFAQSSKEQVLKTK